MVTWPSTKSNSSLVTPRCCRSTRERTRSRSARSPASCWRERALTVPPVEPPPSRYALPDPSRADEHGLVAVGGDLAAGTLLAAYRSGLFPMNVGRQLGWWSPDPRGVLPLDGFV